MNLKLMAALCVAFGLSLIAAGTAAAQESSSPSETWNSSVTFRGASDRAVDVETAEAQERARTGGYGPGSVNYNGPVNNYTTQTYNGPVSDSSAINAVNWTTSSSSITQSGQSQASVTMTVGNSSNSAQQGAEAVTTTTGTGNTNVSGTNGSN